MKVLNKRDAGASAGIYIGRGSAWGNPFVIGRDGDRAEVIEKYKNNKKSRKKIIFFRL